MKMFWWKGKEIPKKEYIRCLKNMTRDDLLVCQKCLRPFERVSKWEWKPTCDCMGNIRIGVG